MKKIIHEIVIFKHIFTFVQYDVVEVGYSVGKVWNNYESLKGT